MKKTLGFSSAIFLALAFGITAFAQEPVRAVRGTFNEIDLVTPSPQPVAQVSAFVVGNTGLATYYYWVVANFPQGNATPSGPALAAHAPNALSGSNFVTISWLPVPGASSYDLLRTVTPLLPNGAATIAVTTALNATTFNDQGAALSSYTLNTLAPSVTSLVGVKQGYNIIPPTGFGGVTGGCVPPASGVLDAGCFNGADAEAKIANAIAALPATGGTVDARGVTGAQTWGATLVISTPVTLLLGNATFTFSGTGPMISIPSTAIGPITIRGVGGYPFNGSLGTILFSNSNDNGITSRMNFNNGPVILQDFAIRTTLGSPSRTQGSGIDIGGTAPFGSCRFVIDGVDASATSLSTSFINGITMSDPIGSTVKNTRATGWLPQMANVTGLTATAATNTGGVLTPNATNYWYVVSAIDGLGGETVPYVEATQTLAAGNSVNLSWNAVTGATGYKIYGRLNRAGEQFITQVGAVTTFTDLGTISVVGSLPPVSNSTVGGDGFHLNRGTSTSFINTYGIGSGRNNYRILGSGYVSFEGTASDSAQGDSYFLQDVTGAMVSPGAEVTANGHGIYVGGGYPFFLAGAVIGFGGAQWSRVAIVNPAVFGDGSKGFNGIEVEGNAWVTIDGGTMEGTKSYDSRATAEGIPQVTVSNPQARPLSEQPLVPDISSLINPGSYGPSVHDSMFSLGRVLKLGQLRPPASLAIVDNGAGGTLPAGTYRFQVTSLDASSNETTPSAMVLVTIVANHTIKLTWTDTAIPVAATNFNVYSDNATGGVPQKIATVAGGTFTFTLSATPTLGVSAPLSNATVGNTATPSVALGSVYITNNTAATTITNFLVEAVGTVQAQWLPGQVIVIIAGDANTTIQNGTNIKLRGGANVTLSLNQTMILVAATTSVNAPVWYEVSSGQGPAVGTYNVTADFTTAANTNLQNIPGLSWTMPANQPLNVGFSCHLMYSQAGAAVADQFGIQDVTVAPTNIAAKAQADISVSTFTAGNLPTLITTTATPIVTFTPSAITTVWNADLDGFIEQPSNAASSAVNVMVETSNSSDLVTVKRGSFCRVF